MLSGMRLQPKRLTLGCGYRSATHKAHDDSAKQTTELPKRANISSSRSPTPIQPLQPAPKMDIQAGTNIVIGGGIVGASIAWHLAHSSNVTIIAEKLGGVATPNSFAWINAGGPNDPTYYEFRNRSMEHWREMTKQIPNLPISWTGALSWDATQNQTAGSQEGYSKAGTGIVRVNNTEMAALEPELEESFFPEWQWGLQVQDEGSIEAHTAAEILISEAEAMGAKVLTTSVSGFVKEHGRVTGVTTANGTIHGDHIILAAGLGSVSLLATENIKLAVEGRAGLLANTLPVNKQYLKTLFHGPDLNMRQTRDGRILAGESFAGSDAGVDAEKTAREIIAKVKEAFKSGEEIEYGYYTLGIRPDPKDGLPILGDTPLEGLDVAVMHSGVTLAAIVGKLIAEKVLTGHSDPILDHFRLDRFDTKSNGTAH
jgi:glycine/D-amino acid oxidase-like deaminating enzyme